MSDYVFEVDDVCFSYPRCRPVLNGVSFNIAEGESVAILGANACGKSTLLHLLDGLYFATRGRIMAFDALLAEETVETQPFAREFRQRVGFLFQNSDAQMFCSTVLEELEFGPLQLRLSEHEIARRVGDILHLFGIEHLRDRSPQTLSGGERKRVALASIITCSPRVILLDEPSAGLDPRTQQWLTEFLIELRKSGVTLICTSHDLGFVAEVFDRVMIISEDHRLIYDGVTKEALHDLELLLSANLIHSHQHRQDDITHAHAHLHEAWHEHRH